MERRTKSHNLKVECQYLLATIKPHNISKMAQVKNTPRRVYAMAMQI